MTTKEELISMLGQGVKLLQANNVKTALPEKPKGKKREVNLTKEQKMYIMVGTPIVIVVIAIAIYYKYFGPNAPYNSFKVAAAKLGIGTVGKTSQQTGSLPVVNVHGQLQVANAQTQNPLGFTNAQQASFVKTGGTQGAISAIAQGQPLTEAQQIYAAAWSRNIQARATATGA